MTRERTCFTFYPRDMLLSLQIGFSFEIAAVACAILERTTGFVPSPDSPLEACYGTQLLPFHLDLPLDAIFALFVISMVFSALISILYLVQICRDFQLGLLVLAFPQVVHLCHR